MNQIRKQTINNGNIIGHTTQVILLKVFLFFYVFVSLCFRLKTEKFVRKFIVKCMKF